MVLYLTPISASTPDRVEVTIYVFRTQSIRSYGRDLHDLSSDSKRCVQARRGRTVGEIHPCPESSSACDSAMDSDCTVMSFSRFSGKTEELSGAFIVAANDKARR